MPNYRRDIANVLMNGPKQKADVQPFGQLFGMGADVERLQNYVDRLPKIRSYNPSPSENRSFWFRENLGQSVGKRVNETVDAVDPITPVRDFIHRRREGYPLGADDAGLALDAAATVAAPFAGKMLVNTLRRGTKFYRGAGGNVDLGRINKQIENATDGRQPEGPIRMEMGREGKGGFGARHITEEKHERARRLGYRDGHHLIEDVAAGLTEVVEQANGKLMLVKRGEDGANRYVITKFQRGSWLDRLSRREQYHGVTTGYPEGSRNVGKRSEILKRSLEKPENKPLRKSEP